MKFVLFGALLLVSCGDDIETGVAIFNHSTMSFSERTLVWNDGDETIAGGSNFGPGHMFLNYKACHEMEGIKLKPENSAETKLCPAPECEISYWKVNGLAMYDYVITDESFQSDCSPL